MHKSLPILTLPIVTETATGEIVSAQPSEAPIEVKPPLAPEQAGPFRYRSKLEMKMARKVAKAVIDFSLLEEGDRVMVCMSGGKDSYTLLQMLKIMQRRAKISFDLLAVNIDQGWPGYRTRTIER